MEKENNFLEDIISQIKIIGFRFSRWALIDGKDYQGAFYSWQRKTRKFTETYAGAEELLGDMYDKNQSIEQLQEQKEQGLEKLKAALSIDFPETELGKILNSGRSGQPQIDDYNKKREAVKLKYFSLIKPRLEFFNYDTDWLKINEEGYMKFLCPYLEKEDIVEEVWKQQLQTGKKGWIEWCEKPGQVTVHIPSLVYQTLPILTARLKERYSESFQVSYNRKDLLKSYLSSMPDEIFVNVHSRNKSGDIQIGGLSIAEADLPRKVLVARAFIEAVDSFPMDSLEEWEEILKIFCSKSEEEQASLCAAWENTLSVSCFLEGVEDEWKCQTALTQEKPDVRNYEKVWERASKIMKRKLAAGAFSLVRDILSPSPEINPEMFYLTGFAEVYKGLEEQFVRDTSIFSPDNKNKSPYTFLYGFVCGEPGGSVREGWFSAPQMVDFSFREVKFSFLSEEEVDLSSFCELLDNNEINTTNQEKAGLILRKRYFHTPVKVSYKTGAVHYPSVYEMAEVQLMGDIYKSGKTKEEFLNNLFGEQTKNTVVKAAEKMHKDLKTLEEEYIVPGLINSTDGRTKCLDLRAYYLPKYDVTEVSPGILNPMASSVEINSMEDQLKTLKGLGIYMFQIHFWMDWIRKVNLTTGLVDVSDMRSRGADLDKKTELFSFNPKEDSLDKVICMVLERLKQYHDSFAGGSSLVALTWKEVKEIEKLNLSEALIKINDKSILSNNTNAPVLIPQKLMLSLIL
ncbi:MAG: hypothetical protein OXB86_01435, partial [Bdellovibrionales bacterium]|nr:hypothetical protein [Bdellovibrionales bacterium]